MIAPKTHSVFEEGGRRPQAVKIFSNPPPPQLIMSMENRQRVAAAATTKGSGNAGLFPRILNSPKPQSSRDDAVIAGPSGNPSQQGRTRRKFLLSPQSTKQPSQPNQMNFTPRQRGRLEVMFLRRWKRCNHNGRNETGGGS